MNRKSLAASVVLALSVACGGGGNPAQPSPTPTTIVVTSTSDLLHIGSSDTFTATVTLSNGTTQAVTAGAWGSDERHIVSVESSGRVTGVGSGMATVFVSFQGVRGTRTIRGLPNYQGTWSGSYSVNSCSQSGQIAAVRICEDTFSTNRVLPMNLTVTQTRDAATSQIALGTIVGSGNGPVQTSGELLLSGTVRSGDLSLDTTWTLQSAQAGRITGNASYILRFTGLSGEARINVSIRDLNRTSNAQPNEWQGRSTAIRRVDEIRAALEGR